MTRPVWAEVNLRNLAFNMKGIKGVLKGGSKLAAVVKANAYGHGANAISKAALRNGADCLCVAVLDEAISLRDEGIQVPIIILGYTPYPDLHVVNHYDLTQTIFELGQAELLSKVSVDSGRKTKIHLKIDTGMGRLGFPTGGKTLDIIRKIMELPGLTVEGIYTHFANADALDKSHTLEQFNDFLMFLDELGKNNFRIPVVHAANSAALMDLPQTHLDMVRPGIILYGHYPAEEVNKKALPLKPVMTLKARIADVKKVRAGSKISYGCTYTAKKDSLIAVIPIGYADGYSRLLSNRGEVLIRGFRAPVVGAVCMDQMMVDVGHIPGIGTNEEVVLIGKQGREEVNAEEIASFTRTINYEVLCRISERIPRKYIQ
ncbi:MAG: alanine racemase [Clostridia bacterium]|nr:alanine racemase [Clostridia bacterium]